MTDYVFKNIYLVDLGCALVADAGFSWENADLIDALKMAV